MDKRFWAIIGVITVLFVGFLFISGNDKANAPSEKTNPTNHVIGNTKSKVTLLEYGDFQCPFCAQFYPIVEQVREKYKEDIAFQFRHLPLPQIHQNAVAAARASEAADAQGKFWEMYGVLYQNQQSWGDSSNAKAIFEQYASQLGLKLDTFKKDFASSKTNDKINADVAAFKATKETASTPTFFLNGKKIQPKSVEDFSKAIDAELAKQKETAN